MHHLHFISHTVSNMMVKIKKKAYYAMHNCMKTMCKTNVVRAYSCISMKTKIIWQDKSEGMNVA